jgi:hypothetical protein
MPKDCEELLESETTKDHECRRSAAERGLAADRNAGRVTLPVGALVAVAAPRVVA